jgi:hypothetical protein
VRPRFLIAVTTSELFDGGGSVGQDLAQLVERR